MGFLHDYFPIYRHNLWPWLLGPFTIGHFDKLGIRWYSLAYIFGFLALYASLYRAVVRRRIPNADLERLEEACLLLILTVIVGGRLGYFILNEPEKLTTWAGWKEVPQVWQGGMAFFGAAVAVFVFEYWYCRKNKVGFWHGADHFMWVLALALGFGRIANFINGELWGIPTNGHWGVIFPGAEPVNGLNVPRHPVQLYGALSHWLLGFYLLYLIRRTPRTKFERMPGFTVFPFFVGYGLLRFITDFWRQEAERTYYGPIHGGQVLSLAMCVVGVLLGWWRYSSFKKRASEADWYPETGCDSDLPPEAHAWIDGVVAARRAEEQAWREARAAKKAKRRKKR